MRRSGDAAVLTGSVSCGVGALRESSPTPLNFEMPGPLRPLYFCLGLSQVSIEFPDPVF